MSSPQADDKPRLNHNLTPVSGLAGVVSRLPRPLADHIPRYEISGSIPNPCRLEGMSPQ